MSRRRWSDLSPRTRRAIAVAGTVDAGLKVWALRDLRRRPAEQVRGPKSAWAAALVLVNGAGVGPLGYYLLGRRRGDGA